MRGQSGELRCGYQVAAQLGAWTFDGERLEAAAKAVSELWLDSEPLDLRLDIGRKVWIWRGVTLLDRNTPLVVRVSGSPETRDA